MNKSFSISSAVSEYYYDHYPVLCIMSSEQVANVELTNMINLLIQLLLMYLKQYNDLNNSPN